ncbi:DUF309 domain-containing protein [Alteribacter aurantiacus]|uniref:DUF309 domain-containing protein n=1 Tax=Alteribacter aurantiacus TaxID=254410 RepID=UPI00042A91DC|nr:DUF309 domain-containing protein [Alteribacter aurantiacus]
MNHYPRAYIEYLIYFQGERDLFECHEVMEEHWKKDKQRHWLALIQLAVALYHQRQGNHAGAKKLISKVVFMVSQDPHKYDELGMDYNHLYVSLIALEKKMKASAPYTPFNIELNDKQLEATCKEICKEKGLNWKGQEDHYDPNLVLKHKKRDRTDVIQARKSSLIQKKKEREA